MVKRDWKDGSYVRSEVDHFESEQEEDLYFAWFHTQANLKPSQIEEREKIEAIKEQIAHKVILPNGLPVGYANQQPPAPPRPKETHWQKRQREIQEKKKLKKQAKKQGQVLKKRQIKRK